MDQLQDDLMSLLNELEELESKAWAMAARLSNRNLIFESYDLQDATRILGEWPKWHIRQAIKKLER